MVCSSIHLKSNERKTDMNFDRREKIRDMLRNKPFVSLHELEEMFPDVSSMTLRRDIDYFEKSRPYCRRRHKKYDKTVKSF